MLVAGEPKQAILRGTELKKTCAAGADNHFSSDSLALHALAQTKKTMEREWFGAFQHRSAATTHRAGPAMV
jgi:hypothetical protein